ncbi:MAG: hypothetical protein ACFCVK_17485 [Acidimicrobiales bacterium]
MTGTSEHESGLRPRERAVKRMAGDGMSDVDIAWRLRRSPGHIQRMRGWMELRTTEPERAGAGHSPIERMVLRSRAEGASHAEIAARLRRTPGFVERVERYAALRPGT